MPNPSLTADDAIDIDADHMIDLMWRGWLALLERYDGRDTFATDPVERMRVRYELHARALMLCAFPAPSDHALGRKAVVAAWLREHGGDTWSATMADAAVAADTYTLQPANNLPA